METIYIIIGLFAFAALLGLILISYVLRSKETPKAVAFIHGPVAAVALAILVVYTIRHDRMFIASIVLFTLAALGGIVLLVKDLTGKPLPKWLAIVHGLMAVAGFTVLLINAFANNPQS
jgi:hypothetical protein